MYRVKEKKSSLKLLSQSYFETEKELLNSMDTSIPITINFSGTSIIEKTVEANEGYLEKVLFNKDYEQFYICELLQDKKVSISIARKTLLNTILSRLEEGGVSIIDFSVGAFVLSQMQQISPEKVEITAKYTTYNFEMLDLSTINEPSLNAQIELSEERLGSHYSLAFSGFLGYLSKGKIQRNYEQTVTALETDSVFKKSFNLVAGFAVVVLFLLLLSSYFIGSIYTEKQLAIEFQLNEHNSVLVKINNHKRDITYKSKVILENSLNSDYLLSQFITEILNNVPKDINIDVFEVFPIIDSKNDKAKFETLPKHIKIEGKTDFQYSVNDWIESLNELEWIKRTEINTFDQLKNTFNFTINIYIK